MRHTVKAYSVVLSDRRTSSRSLFTLANYNQVTPPGNFTSILQSESFTPGKVNKVLSWKWMKNFPHFLRALRYTRKDWWWRQQLELHLTTFCCLTRFQASSSAALLNPLNESLLCALVRRSVPLLPVKKWWSGRKKRWICYVTLTLARLILPPPNPQPHRCTPKSTVSVSFHRTPGEFHKDLKKKGHDTLYQPLYPPLSPPPAVWIAISLHNAAAVSFYILPKRSSNVSKGFSSHECHC